MKLFTGSLAAPIGKILVVWDDRERAAAIDFVGYEPRMYALLARHHREHELAKGRVPVTIGDALGGFFAGDLRALDDVRVNPGGTDLEREVWTALRAIPPGKTSTYGELAKRIGRPNAPRAVGRINGSNPVALVLPCHRVIGASGALTGYGGGLGRKHWLLAHERGEHPRYDERRAAKTSKGTLASAPW